MENLSTGEQVPPQTISARKPRKRTYLVAVAVLVVFLLVLTMVIQARPNPGHQILEADDFLEYSISGVSDNIAFTATANITIFHAEETGLNCFLIMRGPNPAGEVPEFGHDFLPYAGGSFQYGSSIGTEQISTPFGPKCVKVLCNYEHGTDEVVLMDVGVDSYLVYRWTVSSASGAYRYTIELAGTNNSRISSADAVMRSINVEGLDVPLSEPGLSVNMGNYSPGQGGTTIFGSVEVGQGQQLHYVAVGRNTTVYVFTLADLKSIDATGEFRYNATLSRLSGNPGETNVTAEPGTYWLVAFYRGSVEKVEYNGEQVGGYFVAYFGSRV